MKTMKTKSYTMYGVFFSKSKDYNKSQELFCINNTAEQCVAETAFCFKKSQNENFDYHIKWNQLVKRRGAEVVKLRIRINNNYDKTWETDHMNSINTGKLKKI